MQQIYGVTQPIYDTRIVAAFEAIEDARMFARQLHGCDCDVEANKHIHTIPFMEDVDRIKAEWKPCSVESACDHVDDIERPIFG